MAGKKDFVLKDDPSASDLTRDNHYVPQWYQKGFITNSNKLHYLDLSPDKKTLDNGKIITFNDRRFLTPAQCFFEYDLYTTFFGPFISDLIERKLFGKIDDEGARAVRAFIDGSEADRHDRFMQFFNYIDAQKTRTPKGLTWLKNRYAQLNQSSLMNEMQIVQKLNCTIWMEGTREIVSAKNASLKFIISDHPVTIYNFACPPESSDCKYPDDPPVAWKASQTIFPLDKDHCLILTNYEYASEPKLSDPKAKRTNARNFADTFVRTNAFLRDRILSDKEVQEINYVIKNRARRYIAAGEKEWLYPEKDQSINWVSVQQTLLPPANKIHEFSGEMFVGFRDGTTYFQDQFGRTSRNVDYLKKELPKTEPSPNDYCPCGQGKKYKKCCKGKPLSERPSWEELSIRERNITFYNGINRILGLDAGKTWDDVRREISAEQIKEIYELYGFLWPVHTDILSLLPKPDQHVRAVYMGIIDLRILSLYATSATLYFDEILIQSPFINPGAINIEYSPVEKPSQFKQQTLINIALLLALMPFIRSGKINLIPDPGIFNRHLQSQVFDISKQRRDKGVTINGKEKELFDVLMDEEHERMIYSLPENQLRQKIKESNPSASEELITGAYNLMQKKRRQDQLAILQDDLYINGGQVTMMNMAPGFEIALFLAQITGAIVFTDSATRWEEILQAQHKDGILVKTTWAELISTIQDQEFPFNADADTIDALLWDDKFGTMRHVWQNIFNAVKITDNELANNKSVQLEKDIIKETKRAHIAMASIKPPIISQDNTGFGFNAKFQCIIPTGGIEHNHVLRLLVTCGVEKYLKSVPMAIFAQPAS